MFYKLRQLRRFIFVANKCNPYAGIDRESIKHFNNKSRKVYNNPGMMKHIRYYYRSEDKYIDHDKDYYEILGISPEADYQQIKQRFYHLAKECHPDHSKGQENKFKQINQAYNVLSQPNLRTEYDQNRQRSQENDENEHSSKGTSALNYQPYSQMSKMQWAVIRNGFTKQNQTDYTNFQKDYNEQFDTEVSYKQSQQWYRAFRNIKVEQVEKQVEFRKKLHKKYTEDVHRYKQMKQEYKEKRIGQFGDKVQRYFGKRIRLFYNDLMKK